MAILAGLGFSVFTTFTFGAPYLLVFAAGWLIIVRSAVSIHALKQVGLFFLALMIADSPQLFAVLANAPLSHRADWPLEQVAFSIDGLFYRQLRFDFFNQDQVLKKITLVLPGLVFLLGLPLALLARRRREELSSVTQMFLRVFLLYALLAQKWLWVLLQSAAVMVFPWAAGIYMGRFWEIPAAFLIACGISLVAFITWHWLLRTSVSKRVAAGLAGLFLAFMILQPKVHLFYPLGVDDWGEKNYQIAALDELKNAESAPFRVASVLPLQPAYAYAQGLETADGWANIFPAVYRQLWLRVMAPLFRNLPRNKEIFDPDGGRPQDNYIFLGASLLIPGVGAMPGEDPLSAIRTGFDLTRRFNLDLLRLLNVKYLLSVYPLKAPGISLVHAPRQKPVWPQSRDWATGLVNGPRPPDSRSGLVARLTRPFRDFFEAIRRKRMGKDIFIYELAGTLPRFRFAEELIVEPSAEAVLDRLSTSNGATLGKMAIVEAKDAASLGARQQFYNGTIRLVSYGADEIRIEIDNSSDGLLVIANTWNPYWRAEVDGRSRPLVRVNHAQFGLPTLPGEKQIRLFYAPPYAPGFGR